MSFECRWERRDGTAVVTVAGELDVHSAEDFRAVVGQALDDAPDRLVLAMAELTYLSSAGLRCLLFARQKAAAAVDVVLTGVRPEVERTVRLAGLDHAVTFADESG